jgi:hypothetical protein
MPEGSIRITGLDKGFVGPRNPFPIGPNPREQYDALLAVSVGRHRIGLPRV